MKSHQFPLPYYQSKPSQCYLASLRKKIYISLFGKVRVYFTKYLFVFLTPFFP